MIYDYQTSSAMNYYEELGVAPDATEQEIRKAHRRLVKLMHPDAQPDVNMKMLAETQMRRLNSIVSTLLDPEQRRSYDDQLYASAHPVYKSTPGPGWHGIPWWLASAVGAVVLTLAAVWLWADHLGSGFSKNKTVIYIPPQSISPTPSERTTSSQTDPASYKQPSLTPSEPPSNDAGVSTAVVPDVTPESKRTVHEDQPRLDASTSTLAAERTAAATDKPKIDLTAKQLPKPPQGKDVKVAASTPAGVAKQPTSAAVSVPKKAFTLPAGVVIANAKPSSRSPGSQLLPPPGMVAPSNRDVNSNILTQGPLPQATPPPTSVATVTSSTITGASASNPHDPLEGEWVYAPKEPEKRKPGFYPPEFIVLKLFGAGDPGNLKGEYNAKYVVTDRPVSPLVTFELASVSKDARKFVWQGSNGTKGTFSIDPIDDRTIKIDWRTTSAIHGPALTSGTATLVRRQ